MPACEPSQEIKRGQQVVQGEDERMMALCCHNSIPKMPLAPIDNLSP